MEQMTKDDFRDALKCLGISVYRSSKTLGVSLRQAQRYAAGETVVPKTVAYLLGALMDIQKVRPSPINRHFYSELD